ncbi:MAG: hypothetical protein VX640_02610 [Pseudomonadota bacterium]|nr:hypothetical protein [Pseudomonadota bacterium]
MRFVRVIGAYAAAAVVTVVLASAFFTQRIIAEQTAIGIEYTPAQQSQTYLMNLAGLAPTYGLMLAIALLIGFVVAFGVKQVLKPLAPIAYPAAGAAAVWTAIFLIETIMAKGGAGAIGGARDVLGLALQCLAGAVGGGVFALLTRSRA